MGTLGGFKKLPQYPLPTHNVVVRGYSPTEFEANVVCYEEGYQVQLKKELFLGDAISDLPPVLNNEARDEQHYNLEPKTEFQKLIRLRRTGLTRAPCLFMKSYKGALALEVHLLKFVGGRGRICIMIEMAKAEACASQQLIVTEWDDAFPEVIYLV